MKIRESWDNLNLEILSGMGPWSSSCVKFLSKKQNVSSMPSFIAAEQWPIKRASVDPDVYMFYSDYDHGNNWP